MKQTMMKPSVIAVGIFTVAATLAYVAAATTDYCTFCLHAVTGFCGVIAGGLLVHRAIMRDSFKRKRFLQLAVILMPGCAVILVSLAILASEHRKLANAFLESVVYVAYASIVSLILHMVVLWKRRRV